MDLIMSNIATGGRLNSMDIPVVVSVVLLTRVGSLVVYGLAFAAPDKYTPKIPDGLDGVGTGLYFHGVAKTVNGRPAGAGLPQINGSGNEAAMLTLS
jgi:hypothetical protein